MTNHFKGYFVPHFIHTKSLNSSELLVLIALYKLRNDYLENHRLLRGAFLATNKEIARLVRLDRGTVRRARVRLAIKGLIQYWSGTRASGKMFKFQIFDSDVLAVSPIN